MSKETHCSICDQKYDTEREARQCEAQGLKGNELRIGQKLLFAGAVLEVFELLAASHMDHEPGVKTRVVEGSLDWLFVGEKPENVHIFDEETAKKYLVR